MKSPRDYITTPGDLPPGVKYQELGRYPRPGTVDEAAPLAMNQKAAIIVAAAEAVRARLQAEYGRRGDLQVLLALHQIYQPALAWLYDEIAARAAGGDHGR